MATLAQSFVPPKRLLGEVLLDGEFISHSDLNRALEHQEKTNERLGETLVRLGVLTEMELKAVLSHHVELDTPEEAVEAAKGVRHRLGDILLKAKRVNKRQLDRALEEQARTNEKLGEVLVRFGVITPTELDAVLTWQADAHSNSAMAVKLMLGEILVATHVITREQLQGALKEQHLTKKQIGEVLVDAGLAKPNHITEALKIQSKLLTASLVAVLAAGALTGCGVVAPVAGVPDQATGIVAEHGTIQQYTGGEAPQRTVQSADSQRHVTIYEGGSHVIDNVPWVGQNASDNTCAQAASTVVLNYWGVNAGYQQVVNESNRFNLGTTAGSAESYLKSKGLQVKAYRNPSHDLGYLKSLIDSAHPVMVCLDYEGAEHWVVVVGYNDTTNRIIVHDSISGAHSTMSYSRFQTRWANNTLQGILVVGGANYNGLMFDTSK